FQHLAGVPRRRRRQLGARCATRPWRRIARAPGQDDLGAVVERAHERLRPHHADDPRGAIDGLLVERLDVAQRLDASLAQLALDPALVLLGVDDGKLEAESVLAGDLAHDVGDDGEMRLAAGAAARADYQWNAPTARRVQHELEIALHRHARVDAFSRPQIVGTRIGRAAVDADHMWLARHARDQGG